MSTICAAVAGAVSSVSEREEKVEDDSEDQLKVQPFGIEIILPDGSSVLSNWVDFAESVGAVRESMHMYQETTCFTNFTFEIDGSTVDESVELGFYLNADTASAPLTLIVKPELYDMKKTKAQLNQTRSIIAAPPTINSSNRGLLEDFGIEGALSRSEKRESSDESHSPSQIAAIRAKLPREDEVFSSASLEEFFAEALSRTVGEKSGRDGSIAPSDCIKSLSASGWNPPPAYRKSQGDLLYVEAVAEEGVFHITCIPTGFYVNKSSRQHFDPSPAAISHFSHELFTTLLGVSASLRSAWSTHCSNKHNRESLDDSTIALRFMDMMYRQHYQQFAKAVPQWVVPPIARTGSKPDSGIKSSEHTFDISRLHDDLESRFGVSDSGPREWNEELQTVREFNVKNMHDKIMTAGNILKSHHDFNNAVKVGAAAILDGSIDPIDTDSTEADYMQIYLHNNIFYSAATGMKENFLICYGIDANRKFAGHDIRNQKLIQSAGVEGLHTVLSCVIDHRGERLVGQTVIPGVLLTHGNSPARLMCGLLEVGERLTVKTEGLALMQALSSKLHIATRTIAATPSITSQGPEVSEKEVVPAKMPISASWFQPELEKEASPPLLIDLLDEVMPKDSETVPYSGCLEMKVLKGTDGRLYILEALRITPIDANYVMGPKGTGNISAEKLSAVDKSLSMTYALRHELVEMYAQHKFSVLRDKLLREEIERRTVPIPAPLMPPSEANRPVALDTIPAPSVSADCGPVSPTPTDVLTVPPTVAPTVLTTPCTPSTPDWFRNVASPEATPVKGPQPLSLDNALTGEQTEENKAAAAAADDLASSMDSPVRENPEADNDDGLNDLNAKLQAIAEDNMGVALNTNCFIDGFECDVDPAVALKDEEEAREVAHFLYKQALVGLTRQIRNGDIMPIDSLTLVEVIHAHGINMRYLGRLAELAKEQEVLDRVDLSSSEDFRIPSMPMYWLEMVEIEIFARCFKHHLNEIFRGHPEIKHCPAATVATLLNHLFGTSETAPASVTTAADKEVVKDVETELNDQNPLKAPTVKKKKKKSKPAEAEDSIQKGPESVPIIPDAGGDRKSCLESLEMIARSRFCYSRFFLITLSPSISSTNSECRNKSKNESENDSSTQSVASPIFGERISKLTLLRRLCQVTGLNIFAKNFDFSDPQPFQPGDIDSLKPLMSSCEPQVAMTQLLEIMDTTRKYMDEGDLPVAYELVTEAAQLVVQMEISGKVIKEKVMMYDLVTEILVAAGRLTSALSCAVMALQAAVRIGGLDTQSAFTHHVTIATLLAEMGYFYPAVQHLLTAKYLAQLMGGPRHPQLASIYFKLGGIYMGLGEDDIALKCVMKAKALTNDIAQLCAMTGIIVQLHHKMGQYSLALSVSKQRLNLVEHLYGADDEKTLDARDCIEIFHRRVTIENLNAARDQMKQADNKELSDAQITIKTGDGSTINIFMDNSEDGIGCTKNAKKKSRSKKTKK